MNLIAEVSASPAPAAARQASKPRQAAPAVRTLFLLPDYTGLADGMADFAAGLAADGPLECLPCPPLDARRPATLEGLAMHYAQALVERQPEGPYRLAGWSFGGILAYEVAMQLVGRDRDIEFLAMIDANLPGSATARRIAAPLEAGLAPGAYLLGLLRIAAGPAPAGDTRHRELLQLFAPGNAAARDRLGEAIAALADDATLAEVVEACRLAGAWPAALAATDPHELAALLQRWRAHDHALAHYAPFPSSTFVHLFRPHAARPADPADEPAASWESVLRNGEYHYVPAAGAGRPFLSGAAAALSVALVRALRAELQKRAGRLVASPEHGYNPHVPLRQGGSRREPVVMIPGAGSAVTAFMPFCNALDEQWDLHGLQPRGFDGVLVPHASVEAAARTYLAQIDLLSAEHGAPVHLIGHSFGGWIAFDLACRLQARGTPPASLTVIDSEAPEAGLRLGRAYTFTEVTWALVRALEHGSARSMGIDRAAYFGAERREQWEMLHRGMLALRLVHRQSRPSDTYGLVRTYATAMRTVYRPPARYTGPATLVLAADEVESNQGAHQGWQRVAPLIEERRGDGNHYTMLQAPHVASLARWWQDRA
ncbi:alpha/beta fold hydrolase [Burkholderia gladioli]|uniref:thioesterase domain-containing protein n=1 Tax=Burkholderia gladioli TaxID=28095 RepID=UPI00163E2456|nr:alpha/beta fold hydrolase [Burkholderia gladioli]